MKVSKNFMKFASTQGGIKKSILKIWYNNILEKKFSYAAPMWFPRLQKYYGFRLLNSIQYQLLLLISRAYRKTAANALCVLTRILPITLRLKQITAQGKLFRLGLPFEQQLPFFYQIKTQSERICPYQNYFYSQEVGDLQSEVQIYTDGSRMVNGTGYAVCAYQGDNIMYTSKVKLNTENSIYQAELSAILET